ncbi:hypothetical protein BJX68DRAFT_267645 [Aspergillus pseudodeflectus]|uniref:Uncharacterized protein n=1 Tax=Aspergillus pseudodeflectus TaxID=176178 RepID=A0ABR4K7B3_9EURO
MSENAVYTFTFSLFFLLAILPQTAASSSFLWYNATSDAGQVECIYPISGQYALLQRILYYALLAFSVVSQGSPWLVAGALGTAMTFAASAALHATILAGTSDNSLLDLDCLGTFALVSVGSLAATVFFDYSTLLRESPARPVFRYWAVIMIVGTICSVITLWREYPSEEPCYSDQTLNGTEIDPVLLTSPAQLGLVPFNCTYACFDKRQAFRAPSDILVVPAGTVSQARSRLLLTSTFVALFFGTLVSAYRLINLHRYYTGFELNSAVQSSRGRQGDGFAFGKYGRAQQHTETILRQALHTGQKRYRAGWVTHLLAVLSVVVLILNEVFINAGTDIPSAEESYAVGQWGPWVAVIMALAGSAIVEYHRPRCEERQAVLLQDVGVFREGRRGLAESRSPSPRPAAWSGAEGVEVPKATWRGVWRSWT